MLLAVNGCGGGGGGSPAPPATSKAVTKAYLFGTMSSGSIIATVQTSMIVPSGVLANYTSPAGATSGTYPLRSAALAPSGSVLVPAGDLTGTYDIASRRLTINLVNATSRVALQSSSTGSGAEIATIYFNLATPGSSPVLPTVDLAATIGQDRQPATVPSVGYLTGGKVNFTTTFQ